MGADDERGTLNLIDAAAVRRGVAAARDGRVFSLAIPFDEHGPQTGASLAGENPRRTMLAVNTPYTGDPSDFRTSDDAVTMGVQAATHWDALAHVSYDGRLYNGIDAGVVDAAGAHRLGIETFGPITRGLVADVARLHGVDHFDDRYPIGGDDLDVLAAGGVTAEPGDVLLVRTGQMYFLRQGDLDRFAHPTPGLATTAVEWLHDHDVAAVATDTLVFEVWPGEDPAVLLPVHMLDLVDMGMPWASCGRSTSWRPTAPPTAGSTSCCVPLRSRSPAPSAARGADRRQVTRGGGGSPTERSETQRT